MDLLRTLPVARAMSAAAPTARQDLLVSEAATLLDLDGTRALIVLDEGGSLDAIATVQDVESALLQGKPGLTIAEIASRPVVTVFADESLSDAVRKMGARDVGQLPVVARGNPLRVIGMLGRSDIVRAYSHAMLDRIQSQTHRPMLHSDVRGTRIVEVPVESGGVLVGRTIAQLQLPIDTLVVSIVRRAETVIPRGDTSLQDGDALQILVHDEAIASLHDHLASLHKARSPAESSGARRSN